MGRHDEFLAYIRPAVGRVPYGWWTSGHVPPGAPAWADNRPVPNISDVINSSIFCMGVPNLACRMFGLEIPHLGDLNYDGGTVAYFGATGDDPNISKRDGYFKRKGVERPFNLAEAKKRPGTLIGRRYRTPAPGQDSRTGQGHGAIVLAGGRLLQSYDEGGGSPGLNADATIEGSHDGWFYEVMIYPEDWWGVASRPPVKSKTIPNVAVKWFPAHNANYEAANRPEDYAITHIVLHATGGSGNNTLDAAFNSAIGWFQTYGAWASAHYVIRASDGLVAQCVSEENFAYHAGPPMNTSAIGIEHADRIGHNDFTEKQIRSSARLIADICRRHGIPADRRHILLHKEVMATECPTTDFPVDKLMGYVRQELGGVQPPPVTDDRDSLFGKVLFDEAQAVSATRAAYPKANMERCRAMARAIYGVRDIRFVSRDRRYVQFLLETGAGNYGGDSLWPNPAGIKKGPVERGSAVGDEPEDFLVPRTPALAAHIQAVHWCAYTHKPLPPNMDPIHERYWVAKKARANQRAVTRISELGNGVWATDPNYAVKFRDLLDRLAAHTVRTLPDPDVEATEQVMGIPQPLPQPDQFESELIQLEPPKEDEVEDTNPQEPVNSPEDDHRSPRDFWARMDPAVAGALRLLLGLILAACMTALSAFLADYQAPVDASPVFLAFLAGLRLVESLYDQWRLSTGRAVPKPPERPPDVGNAR